MISSPGQTAAGTPITTDPRTGFRQRLSTSPVWRAFRRSRAAIIGLVIIGVFLLTAVFAPLIAPHNPIAFSLGDQLLPASATHPLGTDELGRDVLSRLIWGSRITLLMTVGAVLLALVTGAFLGIVAGYRGGWVDTAIMRCIDVLLAIPTFLLAVAIIAALGANTINVILAVGIGSMPAFARIARGSTIAVKQEDYVTAVRSVGANSRRIMWRHILPNVSSALLVQTTLRLATAVLTASGLSFLGLGPQPPTAEWGAMLSTGRTYLTSSPQLVTVPGIAILLVTIGFNLLGDGLRDALDPRLKR